MQIGEGERRHSERRKQFWKILGLLALIGCIGGFISGFIAGYSDASEITLPDWLLTVAAVAIVLTAVGAAYGSYRFFVSVDEVEVADNLWSSLIGFYVYGLTFPTWWLLARLGKTPPPDHWVIFGLSMITATAVYFFRKWQQR
jgi:Na+-driven multidrug efflux pump